MPFGVRRTYQPSPARRPHLASRRSLDGVIVPSGHEEMTDEELVQAYLDMDFTVEDARSYVEVVRGRAGDDAFD